MKKLRYIMLVVFACVQALTVCAHYDKSPYAYCQNNPVNYVDPDGQDYWATNDPNQIRAFWNALGAGQTQYDFSGWSHATDAEFTSNLVYNDETHKYYTSYTEVDAKGYLNVVGRSFSANVIPVSFDGTGYIGAFAFEPFSDFRMFLTGGVENFGGTNWNVNSQGRLVGYAPVMGVVNPAFLPGVGMTKAIGEAKLLAKGAKLCREFGFSHSQKVYKLGNRYYSWDIDKHNGGVFKVFEKVGGKLKRIGTADENFKIFKR